MSDDSMPSLFDVVPEDGGAAAPEKRGDARAVAALGERGTTADDTSATALGERGTTADDTSATALGERATASAGSAPQSGVTAPTPLANHAPAAPTRPADTHATDPAARAAELRHLLDYHGYRYYALDAP